MSCLSKLLDLFFILFYYLVGHKNTQKKHQNTAITETTPLYGLAKSAQLPWFVCLTKIPHAQNYKNCVLIID